VTLYRFYSLQIALHVSGDIFTHHQEHEWTVITMLASSTQVHGFKPDRSRRIFQGEKFPSTPSFRGEVKPAVPCRRFTACKRTLNVTWKSAFWQNSRLPFLSH
jgi:hypothetical protein